MEKYTKAQMEVIEFENEDVVTVSIPIENCPYDGALLYGKVVTTIKGGKVTFQIEE